MTNDQLWKNLYDKIRELVKKYDTLLLKDVKDLIDKDSGRDNYNDDDLHKIIEEIIWWARRKK